MSYNLFLDDIRTPNKDVNYMSPGVTNLYRTLPWKIARSYNDFVLIITEYGLPDLISFDHDLADIHYDIREEGYKSWNEYYDTPEEIREMTGYDCVKWLCAYCAENHRSFPNYILHSMNEIGVQNMKTYIENFRKHNNE